MSERTQPMAERRGGAPGDASSLFDAAPDCHLPVTVSSGPYIEQLPVGNLPVGEIRRRFRDRFDLDPHSQAVLDGHDVNDETIVRPGQDLMFPRRAGEKGLAP
jgi:hypothetical protein